MLIKIFKKVIPSAIKKHIKNFFFEVKVFLKKPNYDSKVFCIGFNKTGTTSMGKAFQLLGYDNSSFNKKVWRGYYKRGKVNKVLEYTSKFESFDDLPWLKEDMIPILDKTFPNSLFIYLEREEESWKNSYRKWSKKKFGKEQNANEKYEEYISHRAFVLKYFEGANNFLRMQVNEPKAFEKLANFLGKEAPQEDFPHFNKS